MKAMIAIAALVTAGMLNPAFAVDSSAQRKKGCPANYEKICVPTCIKRGGQPGFCPAWCDKRLRNNCAN